MGILHLLVLLWIIYWCSQSEIFLKIVLFLVYTFWMFMLGFFLYVIFVDFNPNIAVILSWVVFVFWLFWFTIIFSNWKSNNNSI